ncbi:ATP-binding protein [Nocardioides plantarum]|uniref:ATP-binding protein n=1 Tax=Nocardioides plantarum TaxID=29299 RepID=A0ABV5K8Q9_9ACTN|nr:ATP-binding protein [Nocardioides plantarum]
MTDEALPAVVHSLRSALERSPDDVPLRLHLAALLLEHDRPAETAQQCSEVLARDVTNVEALALLGRATDVLRGAEAEKTFDWSVREEEVADLAPPLFVGGAGEPDADPAGDPDVIESDVRLDDVGGMAEVKRRLDLAFLTPMNNPELRRLYGRSLHGGLMLYGPPGCGKTFLARAVAGELGAKFYSVSLADVLDMWIGASERNLREIFETARANAPCVLFLDEIDAIGQKRSHLRSNPAMRGTVNQLLSEMDSVRSNNDGVFVLAATNHPWDVDAALLRPGRLDRMLLVSPPDAEARAAVLAYHLRDRPLDSIDIAKLVSATQDFSGADLAHLCDSAAELAMDDSVRSGVVRMITMKDFKLALKDVRPSTRGWLEDARNVVLFANDGGQYDDLLAYLKQRRLA